MLHPKNKKRQVVPPLAAPVAAAPVAAVGHALRAADATRHRAFGMSPLECNEMMKTPPGVWVDAPWGNTMDGLVENECARFF